MIYAQARYADNFRLDKVSAVKSAAQAGFNYGNICLGIRKVHKCQGSHNLKEAWNLTLGYLLYWCVNAVQ